MMEAENVSSKISCGTKEEEEEEDEDAELPGFRFHPTDEELVGFYLRRKVEKRPIRLDLIKHVDIYKFDPWDLPREKGEIEWYFFCRRGKKYKNSMRPNRVTRSGFWKATGIDRPIYSSARECIGLKKSLVYYRGSAGKGTKTDWMMHEFRLPAIATSQQEAEVWTLCRILKRSASYNKYVPAANDDQHGRSYISFTAPPLVMKQEVSSETSVVVKQSSSSYSMYGDMNEFLRHADWEDLRSIVDCTAPAPTPTPTNPF